ncbi:MAG TPA: zf-HC2 domain-containing protein [Acidobacteriota bacterium]|nr:zf-HC2 domain-containing protein [Acidobacteriota bacterium]
MTTGSGFTGSTTRRISPIGLLFYNEPLVAPEIGDAVMKTCSFKKLVLLLDNKLELDEKLEVLNHLDKCGICRDAVYQISRDRDELYFVHARYDVDANVA